MTDRSLLNQKAVERRFTVSPNFDLQALTEDLSLWLEKNGDKKTVTKKTEDGYVLEARETSGRLLRIVSRKEQVFHLYFKQEGQLLFVWHGHGKWLGEKTAADETDGFILAKAAKFAKNAAAEIAEAAAGGVADVLMEKNTRDDIFDFIARHAAGGFSASPQAGLSRFDGHLTTVTRSRYVEELDGMKKSWLAGFLEPGEMLVAWLKTSSRADGPGGGHWDWMLTTRRACLVNFTEKGFDSVRQIGAGAISLSDSFGRDTVAGGGTTWKTTSSNEKLYREIARLTSLDPDERLYQAARLNFVHGKGDDHCISYAKDVLEYLAPSGKSPLHALSLFYLNHAGRGGDRPFDITDELVESFSALARRLSGEITAEQMLDWSRSWGLDPPLNLSLAELIQKTDPGSPKRAELARLILTDAREGLLKKSKNEIFQGIVDIRYAENLVSCGYDKEAAAVLESRLAKLPDESLADLLPAGDSDLTKGEGGQAMKTRILELLVLAKGESGKADVDTLRELAMLQPLVPSRLEALCAAGGPEIKKRAAASLALLKPGWEGDSSADSELSAKKSALALSRQELEEGIRHPASRDGETLNKLQGLIASKKIPDHGSLKSYAKRVTMSEHPELCSAILDAGVIFGVGSPEAFISHGEHSTGVRGYESDPSFILIGYEHLEKGGPHEMGVSELRFLIGAEMAHLKFKHNRITTADVWEGAFEKTMSVMELVPVVGGYLGKIGSLGKFATQAGQFTGKVGNIRQYVSHAWSLASRAQDFYKGKVGGDSGKKDEKEVENELIGAFREMRLTADRAGLVLCGDLKAAVRAIFKSSPRLSSRLSTAQDSGLDHFLSAKDEKGKLLYQDLAIRLAALFSFHLSDDFTRLRSAAYREKGPAA